MTPFRLCIPPLIIVMTSCVNTSSLYDDQNGAIERDIPAQWVNTFIAGSVTDNWLQQLGDKQLMALIEQRLHHNFTLRQSAAKVVTSYAQANVAAGGRLPEIHFNFSGRRSLRNAQASGTGEAVYSNLFDLSLNLAWNIDFMGSLSSREQAAIYQYQAAFAQYQHQLNTTAANITRAWYRLIAEQQLALLDDQRLVVANSLLAQAKSGYSLGLSSAFDLHNQQARILSYQLQAQQRAGAIRQQRRNLELLLAEYPAAKRTVGMQLPELVQSVPAGLPSALLQRRADLLAAQANLKAGYQGIAEARGNRFPSIRLTASAGRSSDELSALGNNNLSIFNLTGSLVQPLFAFGTLKAQEQQARASSQELEISYANLVQQAFAEVEQALDQEQSIRQQLALAEQAEAQYRQAATIAGHEFRTGTGDLTRLANAEISAFDASVNVITLRRNLVTTRVDVYLALGGAFTNKKDFEALEPQRENQ